MSNPKIVDDLKIYFSRGRTTQDYKPELDLLLFPINHEQILTTIFLYAISSVNRGGPFSEMSSSSTSNWCQVVIFYIPALCKVKEAISLFAGLPEASLYGVGRF